MALLVLEVFNCDISLLLKGTHNKKKFTKTEKHVMKLSMELSKNVVIDDSVLRCVSQNLEGTTSSTYNMTLTGLFILVTLW